MFYQTYKRICSDIGVSLAEEDDPDKAFPPSTRGQMLGIHFDSVKWIWWLSEDKISRYVNDILDLKTKGEGDQRTVSSVVGKILYVAPLIPSGKYHLSDLLKIFKFSDNPNDLIVLNCGAKDQLFWWYNMIQLCGGGMPIPTGYDSCPVWAIFADSDAAGGTSHTKGRGVGAVLGNSWAFLLWPSYINSDLKATCCGSRWRHKLSFLELCGHMLHLCAFAKECVGETVCTRIDNSGTCVIARHSD